MSRPTRTSSKGKAAKTPASRKKASTPATSRKQAPASTGARKKAPARTKSERDRLRSRLPAANDRYADLWDRGAARAHTSGDAPALRVALRSAHKKRLAAIEKQTGLDRQAILNRAVESGWRAIQMSGKSLDDAAAKLRRQSSAAAGTVTLHPTAATLKLFRAAKHPNARSILLQTGLNVWSAA